jgi:hypothetical protein
MKRVRGEATETGYTGYRVGAEAALECVDASALTAEEFFTRFVQPRKPCVLRNAVALDRERWSLAGLRDVAGTLPVEVEVRDHDRESFGQGKKQRMTFGSFLERVDQSALMYMTTQSRTVGPVSNPATALVGKWFPKQLPLAGNLVLANLNMWLGSAPAGLGSTTPLHHDFHDNFYLLVQGRKRFTLFAPSDAPLMCTRGKITTIHGNGLINYEGWPTNADGSTAHAVALGKDAKRHREAQRELEEAELAGDDERIEQALESLLQFEQYDDYGDDGDEEGQQQQEEEEEEVSLNHFCILDAAQASLKARNLVVDLEPHQMLYLPCGWFHQVQSSNGVDDTSFHCAVNWWYHPPDRTEFAIPYSTEAWKE